MSDTATTPLPEPDSDDTSSALPPSPRPKRPWTILARLSQAVRAQNWFAVVLEIGIVVLGVVIGFQVTAWGQARSDRAKEQSYLNEIRRDLIETETSLQGAIDGIGNTRYATSALIRAAYVPDTVPRDSLARWLFEAQYISLPTYRMGTASALIETGDLQLIRDDSTRIALSRLVDDVQRVQGIEQTLVEAFFPVLVRLRERTATTDLYADLALLPVEEMRNGTAYIESHAQTIPENGQLSFAEDYAALLNDAASFRDWRAMSDHLLVLQTLHRRLLVLVQGTRQQVEAERNR